MQSRSKKTYSTPKLTAYGTVEEITQACTNGATKQFGSSDGYFFLTPSNPITDCAS